MSNVRPCNYIPRISAEITLEQKEWLDVHVPHGLKRVLIVKLIDALMTLHSAGNTGIVHTILSSDYEIITAIGKAEELKLQEKLYAMEKIEDGDH